MQKKTLTMKDSKDKAEDARINKLLTKNLALVVKVDELLEDIRKRDALIRVLRNKKQ